MKLIKRLQHTAQTLEDAFLGWDIFWSGDYSIIDKSATSFESVKKIEIPKGYTILLAVNISKVKFLKRFFLRIK